MNNLSWDDIKSEVERLINVPPIEESDYYQISLIADDDGKLYYSTLSHWVGFAENPRREIRQTSLINPKGVMERFTSMGLPVFVINNENDFHLFRWVIGGHSIIEKSIVEQHLSYILKPSASLRTYDRGFVNIDSLAEEELNRAPHYKLRMRIINRDKRRCKICGASPANNEHVELHLHNIIPYGKGGITDETNLITLCQTCHKGLEYEIDDSLFDYIGVCKFSEKFADLSFEDQLKKNISANQLRRKEYLKKL
jgi:hypothetical protein